ncbi:uncharacterized protein RCO7_01258 [Rhynchosporium graminicola]|uniref:MFS maltose permease n=1 Tax=Rhynchosporium graminicola TaxID=2792576 RepID=A0A1E1K4A6_9HELO|nr:uncharacterized protein RCO7_01258 [Rhynchosporium commune]
MPPRTPIRRIALLRPLRPPNSPRLFTQNTLCCRSRPQLPFLSSPTRKPTARFLTTERKTWIKDEIWKAGKYTIVLWTGGVLVLMMAFGLQQEYLNHKFPSPDEWSWVTRKDWRSVRWAEDHEEDGVSLVDWARTGEGYRQLLRRLEDPNIDGGGLLDLDDGAILVAGIGKTGYDISNKSEPWRRGYYELLMGAARCAEHLDGYVRDKTRNIAFPANVVLGPSNPNPRPVPPGSKSAPREEDCEPGFEPPEVYYMRILTTQGFTERQRIDAALAYAVWLDYKNTPESALEMHKWALDTAISKTTRPEIDPNTGVITTDGLPSANILRVATALGVHHAINSNLTLALPIFLSVLRARRALPDVPTTMRMTLTPDVEETSLLQKTRNTILSIIKPPQFPPPPEDGTLAPLKTSKEKCEEAGIMTYIGEILYASKVSKTNREDGLAWTREAVDLAEEELHKKGIDKDGKKKCKQCLEVGLGNWMAMVGKMAKDEKDAKANVQSGGWLGFGGEKRETIGRWESEEQVVIERMRRAKDLLDPKA